MPEVNTGTPAGSNAVPASAAYWARPGSAPVGSEQMLKAPVEASPLLAPNDVVGWRPAPVAPLTMVLYELTNAFAPAALPGVLGATAQFAALVMSLMITASARPPPKSRGLARNLSDATSV